MSTPNAVRDDREQLFANLARPDTSSDFFRRVADHVDWTVEGTHPLAGRFTSKKPSTRRRSTGSVRSCARG